jgi:Flp pilus assembly protein TadG
MKKPAIRRSGFARRRRDERGVTMVFVAVCMVAIIAMAALSIDVVTLYLSREETQRAADTAALAAARVISISGITGTANPSTDTSQWQLICGNTATASAYLTAVAGAQENSIAGIAANTVTVTYSAQGSSSGVSDCSTLGQAFAINPTVIVQVTRNALPTLFSRIWSTNANNVSATAIAEAFNPSNSGSIASGGQVIPVAPRCVKPWIIANLDSSRGGPATFVNSSTGAITNPGIYPVDGGVIGEGLTLSVPPSCTTTNCIALEGSSLAAGQYMPALVSSTATAAPSCASEDLQSAIAGCDESTVYACGYQGTVGNPSPTQANLNVNPRSDTHAAVECATGLPSGQDTLNAGTIPPFNASSYPFQITAGSSNPIAPTNQLITASSSIMTIPIYDNTINLPNGNAQPSVNIIGFLQVFVDEVHHSGALNVTVLNVAGCGESLTPPNPAQGNSAVPIRLITPQ